MPGEPESQPSQALQGRLQGINGQDYAAYQSLLGHYTYPNFDLAIEQIPKDPYAPPHTGVYRLRVAWSDTGLSSELNSPRTRSVAARDYLARRFFTESQRICPGRRGTGYSGVITLSEPGQEILDRSSVAFDDEAVEIRFFIGLPGRGRSVDATTAATMLLEELPEIVEASLLAGALDQEALNRHIAAAEDYAAVQQQLEELNLVAFIANGAVLPRASGVDQKPLDLKSAVPFVTPVSMQIVLSLPHAGHVLFSTWASLFHILMAMSVGLNWISYLVVFLFLFLAVWLPCCVSDIVFPLLFVKERQSQDSK